MTIQNSQKQTETILRISKQQRRHEVVLRIRVLQARQKQQCGLSILDESELIELRIEADKNDWLYW